MQLITQDEFKNLKKGDNIKFFSHVIGDWVKVECISDAYATPAPDWEVKTNLFIVSIQNDIIKA